MNKIQKLTFARIQCDKAMTGRYQRDWGRERPFYSLPFKVQRAKNK